MALRTAAATLAKRAALAAAPKVCVRVMFIPVGFWVLGFGFGALSFGFGALGETRSVRRERLDQECRLVPW